MVNTDAPWPDLYEAEQRVLKIQTKLHQWAADDPHRRFDDLFNLVADPAFLVVAWDRVRGNRGARSAGVDGVAPRSIVLSEAAYLPGCEMISKPGGSSTARAGEAHPQERGEASWARHPDRSGSLRPGQHEAGPRADLRGGLQAVQLRFPTEETGAGRHRRDLLLYDALL